MRTYEQRKKDIEIEMLNEAAEIVGPFMAGLGYRCTAIEGTNKDFDMGLARWERDGQNERIELWISFWEDTFGAGVVIKDGREWDLIEDGAGWSHKTWQKKFERFVLKADKGCDECDGYGYTDEDGEIECPHCKGEGRVLLHEAPNRVAA